MCAPYDLPVAIEPQSHRATEPQSLVSLMSLRAPDPRMPTVVTATTVAPSPPIPRHTKHTSTTTSTRTGRKTKRKRKEKKKPLYKSVIVACMVNVDDSHPRGQRIVSLPPPRKKFPWLGTRGPIYGNPMYGLSFNFSEKPYQVMLN